MIELSRLKHIGEIDWLEVLHDPDQTFRRGAANCELCGRPLSRDLSKVYISIRVYGQNADKAVLFTCNKCDVTGSYDIQLSRFLSRDEGLLDWLSHLCEKRWLDSELALRLVKAMVKIRDLTELMGSEASNPESLWGD